MLNMVKYSSKTESGECIFCKIISKEIKPTGEGLFWESEKYMAWLSPYPSAIGHTVLVPKKHFGSDIMSMPKKELQEFVLEAQKVSKHLIKKLSGVGRVGIIMEGTGIDHAHIKMIPMHGTEYLKEGKWKQVLSGKEMFFEKYEGYLVSCDGPKAKESEIKALAKKLKK
jgi:histidine triad (HIT) family protein